MSEPRPVRGVLIAHGAMASGLVDAVDKITGEAGAIVPLSNEGQGPEALRDALDEVIGVEAAVVFTDLQAGSCAFAARALCRNDGNRAIVCGVNLPMLLEFVFNRSLPLDELVTRLVECGRESVQGVYTGPPHADPAVSR